MNLVDQLLKIDSKAVEELEGSTYPSVRLGKVLGVEGPVNVKIQEVKSRRLNEIMSLQYDRKGRMDFGKSFDAKLLMCTEGVIEPDLRNKDLQEHFKCATAKDLCEKLFGSEVTDLSNKILELSGISLDDDDDEEQEVKN